MNVEAIPFEKTGLLSPLIKALLSNEPIVHPLIHLPASYENLARASGSRPHSQDSRRVLVDVVRKQYTNLNPSTLVELNLKKLEGQSSVTITTGHQLCLLTGPMFSILKIASVIHICEKLNELNSGISHVPIFWMASEDHDLEEINHVYAKNQKLEWETPLAGISGRLAVEGIPEVLRSAEEQFHQELQALPLWSIVKTCYAKGTLADATRCLVNELFGHRGLIILDADNPDLKSLFVKQMKQDIEGEFLEPLTSTTHYIHEHGFKTQVNPRECNLFYLKGNQRLRIDKTETGFKTVDGTSQWNKHEISAEVDAHPERFSPNVVLRPLYQETILPNIGYVGGPGEIAYWLQLKRVFDHAQVPFPQLIHRSSALFITHPMKRKLEKLQLEPTHLFSDSHEMESRLVMGEFPDWQEDKDALETAYMNIIGHLQTVDEGLAKSATAEWAKAQNGLVNLEKKTIKALKNANEIKINQWRAAKELAFPGGSPQERRVNIFDLIPEFGEPFVDNLVDALDPLAQKYFIISTDLSTKTH
jgi:bacillithiol synthase